jgi:hypothetical protein
MSPQRKLYAAAAGIDSLLFALAFAVAPISCDSGLSIYFWSGVLALCAMAVLPFIVLTGGSRLARFGWGACFVLLGAAVWLVGLFAANVRLLCRLI